MVRFLVNHPVAVIISTIAFMIVGMIASTSLPVSLLPEIEIPVLNVKINHPNTSARELERIIVKPVREELSQLNNLKQIKSETRNENATIRLIFKHKTNIKFAYLEASEKLDRLMVNLPRDFQRPTLVKSSAADIPVFYLSIFPDSLFYKSNHNLLELSEFTELIIKKQIEQLPQVAMADIHGTEHAEIMIIPDEQKMHSLGISYQHIENALRNNNIVSGNTLIKSGNYQYHLKFVNQCQSIEDIGSIFLKTPGGKILTLSELASISIQAQKRNGLYLYNNSEAICLAIIKDPHARMSVLDREITKLIDYFRATYPNINFEVSMDQTQLLKYSVTNLKYSLLIAIVLSFLIMLCFVRSIKTSLIICISIPASLSISMLFFYFLDVSINIISLTGLILGVGMMVDNAIIVVDNISQFKFKGHSTTNSCIKGTNEVIKPLLSSVLTTCSVFFPLIFMSHLAGALFFEQAIAVGITLCISFFVSILLLPVIYKLFFDGGETKKIEVKNKPVLEKLYEKVLGWFFKNKTLAMLMFLSLIPLGYILFYLIDKEGFPNVSHTNCKLSIDWDENIHVNKNKERVVDLLQPNKLIKLSNSFIGHHQFILVNHRHKSQSEAIIYLQASSVEDLNSIIKNISINLDRKYPLSIYNFEVVENPFEQLISEEKFPLVAEIHSSKNELILDDHTLKVIDQCTNLTSDALPRSAIPLVQSIQLTVLLDKICLFDVDYHRLIKLLKTKLNTNYAFNLSEGNLSHPVRLGSKGPSLCQILSESKVKNRNHKDIPLGSLISLTNMASLKVITANKQGEYLPVNFEEMPGDLDYHQSQIEEIVHEHGLQVRFSGRYFINKQYIQHMILILLVVIMLLYFILAAQFESLVLPLIILTEVFIDITGSLIILLVFGKSLNIISGIGIIVMSGIIINDSILKIDTVLRIYRKSGDLIASIYDGGKRRLKPIIMTSLTTILAMVPLLFFRDMGAEFQQPLALAIIGGLFIGTIVSLYFIPLAFGLIYRNKKSKINDPKIS